MSQTANPGLQHVINQSLVFHYIRKNGPTYRSQIAEALDISLPAVSRALDALVERGFAKLVEYKKNGQTRTVPYYDTTLSSGVILSVDLLSGIISAFGMQEMSPLSHFRLPGEKPLLDELCVVIDKYMGDVLGQGPEDIKSICVGCPGIVDVIEGVVKKAVYHPALEHVPLRDLLAEKYACTVFVDNVVNIAVWANYYEFKKEYRNIISIDLGMEIGAGLLINGAVYRGENCIAGEIGFYTNDIQNPRGNNCKHSTTLRRLCVEASEIMDGGKIDIAGLKKKQCVEIASRLFEAAYAGDEKANVLVDHFVSQIAIVINKIDPLLNPAAIVIGGDICVLPHSAELFLDRLNECYRSLRFSDVVICYSRYGHLVTLQGGGMMALENYLSEQFPYVMGN